MNCLNKFMIVLFVLNIFTVNIIAWRDRDIGEFLLPEKIKGILFPFFYIKRFSKMALLCQIFNFITFSSVSLMLYIFTADSEKIMRDYCLFEKIYIIGILLYSEGRRTCINLYHMYKKRENGVIEIIHKMGGELYYIGGVETIVLKPAVVEGSVFIMLGGLSDYISEINNEDEIRILKPIILEGYISVLMGRFKDNIPEIYYREVLQKILDKNKMIICIKKCPVVNLKEYVFIIKMVCSSFDLYSLPTYILGCGTESVLESLIVYCALETDGMILIDKLPERKLKRKLKLCVEDDFFNTVLEDKFKVNMINIYEKNIYKDLSDWMKYTGEERVRN